MKLRRSHRPRTRAGWAGLEDPLGDVLTDLLPGHLEHAEPGDLPEGEPGLVVLERCLELLLNPPNGLRALHVDKVDHQEPREAPKHRLTGDLLSGLDVGPERCFLGVLLPDPPRIYVNGHKGLGAIQDDAAPRGEIHLAEEHLPDLALHIVAGEKGQVVLVELHHPAGPRHNRGKEVLDLLIEIRLVHPDLGHIGGEVFPEEADSDALVPKELSRGLGRFALGVDRIPQPHQLVHVPDQVLLSGDVHRGGPGDHPEALGNLEARHHVPETCPMLLGELLADAETGSPGHQHQEPPRQTHRGGQGGALLVDRVLGHLDHQLPTGLEDLLDAGMRRVPLENIPAQVLDREEPLPYPAILQEGRLEGGVDRGDAGLVHVAFDAGRAPALDFYVDQARIGEERYAHLSAFTIY